MWLLQLILLLAIYSVGPGFFFLRYTPLAPAEKLVASIGLSYLFVYLCSFAWYLTGAQWQSQATVSVICLVLTVLSLRDLRRLFAHRQVRRMLAAYGLFLAWAVLLLSFVRHYGGGTWGGDWLEQYQRTLFFLTHRPKDTLMIGLYPIPARPAMMNLVAASLMAQSSPLYDNFQLVYTFLNSLVFLPVLLIAKGLFRRPGRKLPWVLLLVLAASPMVAQNLTYSWSKLFAAFYALLGTHLYLRGWRKGSRTYLVFAFASLCAGFIVHHSAGPYALFLGLHYAAVAFWRRRKWAEAATIGVVSAAILATWFGWTAATYGGKAAVASNSTVTDSAVMTPAENAVNVAKNVLNTIVPRVLQKPSIMEEMIELRQRSTAGRVRDFTFLMYQVSLTFGLGTAGAAVIGYLGYRARSHCSAGFPACSQEPSPSTDRSPARWAHSFHAGWKACTTIRAFWLAYALVVFVVGVAVYGGVDQFGVAHICLQGLILIGLALIAAGFRSLPLAVRAVLVLALAVDLCLGILLHLSLESHEFRIDVRENGAAVLETDIEIAQSPRFNWSTKAFPERVVDPKLIHPEKPDPLNGRGDDSPLLHASLPYWGDRFDGLVPALQLAVVVMFGLFATLALRPERGPPVAAWVPFAPAGHAPPTRGKRPATRRKAAKR